jgi:hypothetical protein
MKRVPTAVSAVATMNSPAAQIEAATRALQQGGQLPASLSGSSGETVDMIAGGPMEVLTEAPSAEMIAAAAAAPEA